MATHGRGGLARLVMGGVATRTLQQANVHVLMYQPLAVREEHVETAPQPDAYVVSPAVPG